MNTTMSELGLVNHGVSAAQAAVILGCCEKTVLRQVRAGKIPHVRLGKKIVISREVLMRMLAGQQVTGAES